MPSWRFPSNDYGEKKGLNDSGVSIFRGNPLKSLAREICQNSLDAAEKPTVRVEFSLFKTKIDDLPGKDVLKDAFERCVNFWDIQRSKSTKEFFNKAIEVLEKKQCSILRISDFNTTGLTGSSQDINTDWTNLTKSSGVSDKKGTAGGSFGIGKFAPFTCSYLSTVFYSTYDKYKKQASQGVSRLVSFEREDGQTTQGIGYFGEEQNKPSPEQLKLDPTFERGVDEFGTDIYVAGYKYDNEDWEREIIVSVLDGFLGAIWNKKLEVNVGDFEITKDNLESLMELFKEDFNDTNEKQIYQYYKVFSSQDTIWHTENFLALGDVKLGILLGDPEFCKRVAMIRQTGMKIMDKNKLPGHVPFVGVMLLNGTDLNARLRAMENPEHTLWEPERSTNPIGSKSILKELHNLVKRKIEEVLAENVEDAIDAVGVGNYLPDDISETDDKSQTEEIATDKVIEVEVKKVEKKAAVTKKMGQFQGVDAQVEVEGEDPELEEDWTHPGSRQKGTGSRPGDIANPDSGGEKKTHRHIAVGIEKFAFICVDKDKGDYVLKITPESDAQNAEILLYLSTETQGYEAPVKTIKMLGGEVNYKGNKIKDISLKKGNEIRFKLELDFYDYCSLEVLINAIEN